MRNPSRQDGTRYRLRNTASEPTELVATSINPADVCSRCKSMTSTPKGLVELVSERGFELNYLSIVHASEQGCLFCKLLRATVIRKTKSVDRKRMSRDREATAGKDTFVTCKLYLNDRFEGKRALQDLSGEEEREREELERFGEVYQLLKRADISPRIWVYYYVAKGFPAHEVGSIDIYAPEGDRSSVFLPVRADLNYAPQSLLMHRIKDQFLECRLKHNKKCFFNADSHLPTRIIAVGSKDETPFLHISQASERASYVALSYCWGGPQKVTTTIATLQSRISGLHFESLPRTLQDAIAITRILGFKYLWVDALCIVQDSTTDKIAEINSMGNVYKNATITIAAANASSVNEGFLEKATPPNCARLPFSLPSGDMGAISCHPTSYSLDSDDNVLGTRAWALQEHLLSPRLIYFGNDYLAWKCLTTCISLVSELKFAAAEMRLPNNLFDNTNKEILSRDKLALTWKNVVEDYSGRALTVPEDRLPALSGVASELQHCFPSQNAYYAGMWEIILIRQIGWFNREHKSKASGLQVSMERKRQGPTWSWVSLDHPVRFVDVCHEAAIVISCKIELAIRDAPFGEVTGGTLTLRAVTATYPCSGPEGLSNRATITMDEDHPAGDSVAVYVCIGKTAQKMGVGLILLPAELGNFKRIGQIRVPEKEEDKVWSRDIEMQTITII